MIIVKIGFSTPLPLVRHSIDHFIRMIEEKGKGWRGEPMEAHVELKEIKKWIVPSKQKAKELEKRAKDLFLKYDLLPERVQGHRRVNGSSEIYIVDSVNLELFIQALDQEFPGDFSTIQIGDQDNKKWFYILEVVK